MRHIERSTCSAGDYYTIEQSITCSVAYDAAAADAGNLTPGGYCQLKL